MTGLIYKITNKINGKVYVGQTRRPIKNRWRSHLYEANILKLNTKFARAIRKYGSEAFFIEILEKTDNLNEREIFWISQLKSCNKNGYNLKIGGSGGPHAEETKIKISKANTKRVWTSEMRGKMSDSIKAWHKNRGFVPRSEEFKNKISKANAKRKMSEKTKTIFQNYNCKNRKPVICITNGIEYPSVTSACKSLNLNDGHLRLHLKGKCSHVKGLVFKIK